MSKYLITIVGPTAIGKTALAIQIANYYKTEILSGDSRQFYKEMCIGTAVPSREELKAAPHHFIQHLSVEDTYSIGHYEREAIKLLDQLFTKHSCIVLVGGSGLYVDAVLHGLDTFPPVKTGIRESLSVLYEKEGIIALQHLLKEKDPEYYNRVDLHNHQRIIRALEVCLSSGKPFSSFQKRTKISRDFKVIKIGIQAGRSLLYDRINRRVDQMVVNGLVEEARNLLSRKHLNALQTVGYRELFHHFDNQCSLDEAIEKIKINTRRFAKRQLTWYRKDTEIEWFDYTSDLEAYITYIQKKASF